jgi:hypothetical protein
LHQKKQGEDMDNAADKPVRAKGRPFKRPGDLVDFRISVSFPRSREKAIRKEADRQGLHISAFVRQAVLLHLERLGKGRAA